MLTNHRVSILQVSLKYRQGFEWGPACQQLKTLRNLPALSCLALPCFAMLLFSIWIPRNFLPELFCSVVSCIKRPGKSLGTLRKLQIQNTSNTHVNYVWNNKPFEHSPLRCMGCAYIAEHETAENRDNPIIHHVYFEMTHETVQDFIWICR